MAWLTHGPGSSMIGEGGLLLAGLLGRGGEGKKWATTGEEERVGRMTGKGEERKRNSFLFS